MRLMVLIFIVMGFWRILFAFPPYKTNFTHLLSDKGEIISNTLQPTYAEGLQIIFSGKITLTGVLERNDNYEEGSYYDELRFYPDSNLSLPFIYSSYCFQCDENSIWRQSTKDIGEKRVITNPQLFSTLFKQLHFGVLLTNRDTLLSKLPQPMRERIYGASAVRVRITLTDYGFYGEGDAGREAWAKALEILPISNAEISYYEGEIQEDRVLFSLNTKDSYVNLRKTPNGEILTPITKEAMAQGGMIISANYANGACEDFGACLNPEKGDWFEVYYIPPKTTNGSNVRFGYIHKSQIREK